MFEGFSGGDIFTLEVYVLNAGFLLGDPSDPLEISVPVAPASITSTYDFSDDLEDITFLWDSVTGVNFYQVEFITMSDFDLQIDSFFTVDSCVSEASSISSDYFCTFDLNDLIVNGLVFGE